MLLSAVSVLVVAQSSSEIPEGLMNNPVYDIIVPVTNATLVLPPDEPYCSMSLAVHLPCYQPTRYNCFHLTIIFKFVTANI